MAPKDPSAARPPSPAPGVMLFLMSAGAAAATAPVAGLPWVPPFAHAPWALSAFYGSVGASVIGLASAAWAWTRPPPPKPLVEAHVAFSRKDTRHFDPVKDAEDIGWKRNPQIPDVKAAKSGDDLANLSEAETLDFEIQALKQKLARAKVQFGMGKLSESGYTEYVTSLKTELAQLESRRVGAEESPKSKAKASKAKASKEDDLEAFAWEELADLDAFES